MWSDSDAAGLRAAELVSAESSTRALRSSSSALDLLPDGGFRVSGPNQAEARPELAARASRRRALPRLPRSGTSRRRFHMHLVPD